MEEAVDDNSNRLRYEILDCDKPLPLLHLPDEMTIKIFSYLHPRDLIFSVCKVCRFWEDLAFDPSLWTTLNLDIWENMTSVALCQLLKQLPGIQRLLKVSKVDNFSTGSLVVITELLPSLVELDLSFCTLNIAGLDAIVKNCNKLETLVLEGCDCYINDRFVIMLCEAKQLKHLNFSHCILTEQQLVYISKHLCEIRSLDINGVLYISDMAMEILLNKHFNYLQELTLDGEELSDQTVHLVAKCYKLQKLQILFCELLTDLSLHYLEKLKNLKCLTLRKGPGFSTEAFLNFFLNFDLSRLQYLDVSECPDISDEAVLTICQKCGPILKYLNLSWCWHLSETSLISIVDHCSTLAELKLVGVDIKGDCLHRVPEEMTKLIFCDFEKCSFINDEVLENVVILKPDITIMNYHGEKLTNSLD